MGNEALHYRLKLMEIGERCRFYSIMVCTYVRMRSRLLTDGSPIYQFATGIMMMPFDRTHPLAMSLLNNASLAHVRLCAGDAIIASFSSRWQPSRIRLSLHGRGSVRAGRCVLIGVPHTTPPLSSSLRQPAASWVSLVDWHHGCCSWVFSKASTFFCHESLHFSPTPPAVKRPDL